MDRRRASARARDRSDFRISNVEVKAQNREDGRSPPAILGAPEVSLARHHSPSAQPVHTASIGCTTNNAGPWGLVAAARSARSRTTLQTGDKFDRPERKHQYEERDPDIAHAVFPLNERPEAGDSALHP